MPFRPVPDTGGRGGDRMVLSISAKKEKKQVCNSDYFTKQSDRRKKGYAVFNSILFLSNKDYRVRLAFTARLISSVSILLLISLMKKKHDNSLVAMFYSGSMKLFAYSTEVFRVASRIPWQSIRFTRMYTNIVYVSILRYSNNWVSNICLSII